MKVYYAQDLAFPDGSKSDRVLNIFDNELVKPIESSNHPEAAEMLDNLLTAIQAVWVINDGIEGNNHATIYSNMNASDLQYYVEDIIIQFCILKNVSISRFTLYVSSKEVSYRASNKFEFKLEKTFDM